MPITQERMLLLLDAAEACYEAFDDIGKEIDELQESVYLGVMTADAAWAELQSYRARVQIPPGAMKALGVERGIFSHRRQHDNNRRRMKAEQKRRSSGITPQTKAQQHSYIKRAKAVLLRQEAQNQYDPTRGLTAEDILRKPAPVPRHRHLNAGFMEQLARETATTTTHTVGDREITIPPAADAIVPDEFDPQALVGGADNAMEYPDDGPADDSTEKTG